MVAALDETACTTGCTGGGGGGIEITGGEETPVAAVAALLMADVHDGDAQGWGEVVNDAVESDLRVTTAGALATVCGSGTATGDNGLDVAATGPGGGVELSALGEEPERGVDSFFRSHGGNDFLGTFFGGPKWFDMSSATPPGFTTFPSAPDAVLGFAGTAAGGTGIIAGGGGGTTTPAGGGGGAKVLLISDSARRHTRGVAWSAKAARGKGTPTGTRRRKNKTKNNTHRISSTLSFLSAPSCTAATRVHVSGWASSAHRQSAWRGREGGVRRVSVQAIQRDSGVKSER